MTPPNAITEALIEAAKEKFGEDREARWSAPETPEEMAAHLKRLDEAAAHYRPLPLEVGMLVSVRPAYAGYDSIPAGIGMVVRVIDPAVPAWQVQSNIDHGMPGAATMLDCEVLALFREGVQRSWLYDSRRLQQYKLNPTD